jgi:thymidylate synthase (FAD)
VTEPQVYIISRPTLDLKQIDLFLSSLNLKWIRTPGATEAEELIEFSGRVCYLSFGEKQSPRSNRDYILNLITSGHESVLEHASWSLLLTNVSRAFTHQLVRHRVGVAFSQLSQQYHDEGNAQFVMPTELASFPEARAVWEAHSQSSVRAYELLKSLLANDSGLAMNSKERNRLIRSAARSVLPNSTETKIVMTANARAIRHFLKIRGNILGDYEMRLVAARILNTVKAEAPGVFYDFEVRYLPDGSPQVIQLVEQAGPNPA